MRRSLVLSTVFASLATLSCGPNKTPATAPPDAVTATAPAETATASISVTGSVRAADGSVPKFAHVRIFAPGSRAPIAEAEVDGEGRFELETTVRGLATVEVTGVDHAQKRAQVLVGDEPIELNVALGTYARPEPGDVIEATGLFVAEKSKRFSFELKKGKDGLWTAELDSKDKAPKDAEITTFQYQLTNLTSSGRTCNGTLSESYVYDGGGDYFSVLSVGEGGKVSVSFDPKELAQAGAGGSLTAADPKSPTATLLSVSAELDEIGDTRSAFLTEAMAAKDGPKDEESTMKVFAEAAAQAQAAMAKNMDATPEGDELGRRARGVAWANMFHDPDEATPAQQERARALLASLEPEDALWGIGGGDALRGALVAAKDERFADYAKRAIEGHPNPAVGGSILFAELVEHAEAGELDAARERYKQLSAERFAGLGAARIAKMYDPDRPTAPGQKMPKLEVPTLDGKGTIRSEDLEGKYWVLDFWATWCGPCVREMPELHRAYASINGGKIAKKGNKFKKVKQPKVEIVSVSFDGEAVDATKFHAKDWSMPWTHGFADDELRKQLHETFGIAGIPMMVLVGPDGTILASSPQLRGATLESVVAEKVDAKG